jgi:hypothetical protein
MIEERDRTLYWRADAIGIVLGHGSAVIGRRDSGLVLPLAQIP